MSTRTAHFWNSRVGRLLREAVAFGAVGVSGIVVNFLVFNFCTHLLGAPTVRSSVAGTLVAICTNYLGYRLWVYRDRERGARSREITLFLLFSALGLLIENGVLYATHYWVGWNSGLQDNVVKFTGMGLATLFRFGSYRTWVFRSLPASRAQPPAEQDALS